MLEFSLSFVGLIMFIYVFTRVWSWTSGMIVQRQQAFQHSRIAAGQPGSAGAPVGYARPPIRLVGQPSSPGGDPHGLPSIGEPPCTAAQPFYDQARVLLEEARDIADNQLPPVMERLKRQAGDLQIMVNHCASLKKDQQQNCFRAIPPMQAALERTQAELKDLEAQLQAKMSQIQQLVAQGNAACP